MKTKLILLICLAFTFQACKKDKVQPAIEKPQLPADPEEGTPTAGIPQQQNPNSDVVWHKITATLGYNQHVSLDINNDGVAEFNFFSVLIQHDDKPHLYLMASTKTAQGSRIIVQDGDELVVNALWSKPLEAGQVIGSTVPAGCSWSLPQMKGFISGSSRYDGGVEQSGLWTNKKDKFLGIKFKLNDKYHYGWVKLSHDAEKDLVGVTEYAYRAVAEQSILAGEKE